MSCVIAYKDKDNVIFVSDSRSSTERYHFQTDNQVDGKITRYYEDPHCLIGHVGDTRDISIIKQIPGLFNDFSNKYPKFDYQYIRGVMLPKIREEYVSYNLYGNKETHECPTRLVVAKDDKSFLITEHSAIVDINNFTIEGSGATAALGSYYFSKDTSLLIKALKAIKAAIKYNSFCGYPVLVCSTKSDAWYSLSKSEVDAIINGEKEINL